MLVDLSNVTIRFGSLTAVDDVSLRFTPGSVHAVVGENGAGKTTVMNALFGMLQPAAGMIRVDGVERRWSGPQDAIACGIGMVHQHFMLQPSMSVLENVVLCNEPLAGLGFVSFAKARAALRAIAHDHGIEIDLEAQVARLSLGQRQIVEILKLLYRHAELLILDEPTAVLTPQEKDRLFTVLRGFRDAGKSIVLITHKLDEVMELADMVSVMRAGKLVAGGPIAVTSRDQIARQIVGGALPAALPRAERPPGEVVLAVAGLRPSAATGPFDFEVRAGEILGITGVSGNGQAALVAALTGMTRPLVGSVRLAGQDLAGQDVAAHRAAGLSFIPEDRQTVGLALAATVAENASVGRLDEAGFRAGPFLRRAAMAGHAADLIARYHIRVAGPQAAASTMSGGNKQKLVVGRELARSTSLIVVENPTWGVDIGAIDFIHRELMRMRDAGHAIVLVSTELDEVLTLGDRIAVMFAGRMSAPIARAEATRERVGALMVSQPPAAAS